MDWSEYAKEYTVHYNLEDPKTNHADTHYRYIGAAILVASKEHGGLCSLAKKYTMS